MGRHIVVCCDGTWCGDGTSTTSNIKIIADSFADEELDSGIMKFNRKNNCFVRFFDGVGVAGSFADYLSEGALAANLKDRCVEAYRFIVECFEPGARVWLFGLSRGAYTVRCVAGMINNCGILLKEGVEIAAACEDVYSIYRDRDPGYHPTAQGMKDFRQQRSHRTKEPPIKFMGLLDTVGALGIPQFSDDILPTYQFYDQNVSWEVETVFQALAVHDRLGSIFTPCYARRSGLPPTKYRACKFVTEEVWFPGSHYDIGRQRFVLLRSGRGQHGLWPALEGVAHWLQYNTNLLHLNIMYTPKLANGPLLTMIQRIKEAAPALLPSLRDDYLRYAKDASPQLWRLFPPFTTDAYDGIYNSFIVNGVAVALPISGRWLALLLDRELFGGRHIPIYQAQAFFAGLNEEDQANPLQQYVTGYLSPSFKTYQRMGPALIWVT